MKRKLKLRLVLDVSYDLEGTAPEELKHNLNEIVKRAAGEGLFTNETPATVDQYSYQVKERR